MMPDWVDEAAQRDALDPLGWLPDRYSHPADTLYFDGNSLGLQSDTARAAVLGTLQNWAELGVMGWTETSPPWFTWVERVSAQIAGLLGAVDGEITLGSSTTVMLHQLLATLHPSSGSRWKVLMDSSAFPTDRYAVASFLQGRGHNPRSSLVLVEPRSDRLLHAEDIVRLAGTDVALAVLPSVVFTTGQTLPMEELTRDLRERGVQVIWDLSHSAGLLPHQLHWDRIDAAVFCTYKYLNGGPGAPGGAFIHQSLWPVQPGLQGWWGSANERQFDMTAEFLGAGNAHALQLGTPNILALSALAGSVSLLSEVGIEALHRRALDLVSFLDALVRERLTPLGISVLTPSGERGGHLALAHPEAQALSLVLRDRRVIPDFRFPDIIRLAPVPTTTRYRDCARVVSVLHDILTTEAWKPYQHVRPDVL